MFRRRMASLAIGLVCAGMTLSVSGHAGWAPQKAQAVASMGGLDLPELKKPITKRFVNAKVSEVLAWLSLEQFSFVADSSEFSQDGSVTLNFRNQPLGAVLDAIADAFNGRWERRGEIFNLRPQFGKLAMPGQATAPAFVGGATRATETTPFAAVAPRIAEKAGATSPVQGEFRSGAFLRPMTTAPAGTVTAPLRTAQALTPANPLMRAGELIERVRSVSPPLAPVTGRTAESVIASPVAPTFRIESIKPPLNPQNPKEHEEAARIHEQAMKEMERALKLAEQEMRRLHESGEWKKIMEKAMAEARATQGDDHKKAMEHAHRAMEEARKAMMGMPQSAEWKKAWQKAREEMAKALREGKVVDNGKERKMTDKERKMTDKERQAIEKSMKAFEKMPEMNFVMPKIELKEFAMPKLDSKMFVLPNVRHRGLLAPDDPEFKARHEAIKKEIEKMNQHMKGLGGEHRAFGMPKLDAKAFDMPKLDSKVSIGPKFKADQLMKLEGLAKVSPFTVDSRRMRIHELLASLTPAQAEKQEKQGYLTLEDLTPKQREMLGDIPKDGNWTFSFSIDGKKLTIKGK
jgi:hypothetical protein